MMVNHRNDPRVGTGLYESPTETIVIYKDIFVCRERREFVGIKEILRRVNSSEGERMEIFGAKRHVCLGRLDEGDREGLARRGGMPCIGYRARQ